MEERHGDGVELREGVEEPFDVDHVVDYDCRFQRPHPRMKDEQLVDGNAAIIAKPADFGELENVVGGRRSLPRSWPLRRLSVKLRLENQHERAL